MDSGSTRFAVCNIFWKLWNSKKSFDSYLGNVELRQSLAISFEKLEKWFEHSEFQSLFDFMGAVCIQHFSQTVFGNVSAVEARHFKASP